jgi:putative DNA primase/helicase
VTDLTQEGAHEVNLDGVPYAVEVHDIALDGVTYRVVCGFHRTDEGNAQRLIFYFGDVISYAKDIKTWLIWDGVKWAQDVKDQIFEYAKDTVRLIGLESNFVNEVNEPDKGKRRKEEAALDQWAYQSEAMVKIKAMVELAKTDPRIARERTDFNANRFLLNFPNGTLDLKKRVFREHRKEDMLTMVTGAPYNPTKRSTYFFPTLKFALPHDQAINLQRRLGLALEGTTKNKELILTYGKPYSCKSSITQAFYEALGDYAKPFEWTLLAKNKHGIASNAARPDLVALEDAVIAWTEETPDGMVFDDATVKSLTSSGEKSARGLFEKQRTISLKNTFCLETNGAPLIDIDNEWQRDALLQRIGVTPFLHTVPEKARDKDVFKQLTEDEDELTVALAWGIQGYFDRIDYGLVETEDILESSARFEADTNPLSPFVESQVLFDDGTKEGSIYAEVYCSVVDLFQRFKETSERELRERFKNERSFNIQLKRAMAYYGKKSHVEVSLKRRSFGYIWTNVQLREIEDDIEEERLRKEEYAEDESVAKLENAANEPVWCKYSLLDCFMKENHQIPYFATPNDPKASFPIVKIGLGASIKESGLYKERVLECSKCVANCQSIYSEYRGCNQQAKLVEPQFETGETR